MANGYKSDLDKWLKNAKTLHKAVAPSNFAAMARTLTDKGPEVVDHKPHLDHHPAVLNSAQVYKNNILESPEWHTPQRPNSGVTEKLELHTSHPSTAPASANQNSGVGGAIPTDLKKYEFLIKPYHDGTGLHALPLPHPIQGWAEMATHALFHAGGLGHLTSDVHTAEHDMSGDNGLYKEKEPVLVINKEKGAHHAYEMPTEHFHPEMIKDAVLIGAMDFLTNNDDRHGGNLMYFTDPIVKKYNKKSRLLAIDHARNMQYPGSWNEDNLQNYLDTPAFSHLNNPSYETKHDQTTTDPRVFVPTIAEWWGKNRDSVIQELHKQVESIKDPAVKQHILINFNHRVHLLDKIHANPESFIEGNTITQLKNKLSVPNNRSNLRKNDTTQNLLNPDADRIKIVLKSLIKKIRDL